jgi:hypothetical protein
VVNTMQAVSVDTAGNLANALSYESVINGDGSQVAFTSLADNLVADDTNAFADVFVRDFNNNKTVRVSESLNRFAIGTIRFPALPTLPATPPDNNLRDGDSFTLRDGTNEQTLTFRLAPTGGNEVLIGATASASRENLVRAINALHAAGSLNILAIADSPASPNTFYPPTSRVPGQAYYPGLFLLASVNGSEATAISSKPPACASVALRPTMMRGKSTGFPAEAPCRALTARAWWWLSARPCRPLMCSAGPTMV